MTSMCSYLGILSPIRFILVFPRKLLRYRLSSFYCIAKEAAVVIPFVHLTFRHLVAVRRLTFSQTFNSQTFNSQAFNSQAFNSQAFMARMLTFHSKSTGRVHNRPELVEPQMHL